MSIELDLLMVKSATLEKHSNDQMIKAIWNSRYVLDKMGPDGKLDLKSARKELSFLFEGEDQDELETFWADVQQLAESGELPIEQLDVGSEWNRLADFFEREPMEKKRALLLGAFYGIEPLGVSVETSYGQCHMVSAKDASSVATELKKINLNYLNDLGKKKIAFPSTVANSPDDEAEKMANLAKAFGLPPPPKDLKLEMPLSPPRDVSHLFLEAEDFDLETVTLIAGFYERACKQKCGVLCGIV